MITILIGNEPGDATLEFPETRCLPSDCTFAVGKHILQTENPVIRTYSEWPVNMLGDLIDQGFLNHEECIVKLEGEIFKYNEKGYLIDWRYGYFLPDAYSVSNLFKNKNLL